MKTWAWLSVVLLAACGETAVELKSEDAKGTGEQGLGIATGVEFNHSGPVYVTTVDLCAPGVSVRTTAANERGQTVSAFSNSVGAAVAINGDFFNAGNGYSVDGIAGHDGSLWSANDHTYVGPVAFGHNRAGIIEHGDTSGPKPWMREVVSGHPSLVVNGVRTILGNTGDSLCDVRHPRTAVGLSADKRRLILVAVDGRRAGAPGMRCDELSALMSSLGAHDAMALDGGGSTTMVAGGVVRNQPSDGAQRKVGNHLAVIATGSGPGAHCPVAPIDENLWVSRLYARVLGRAGSAGEIAGWANPVRDGTMSRAQVAGAFLGSAESRTRRVGEAYARYLKRGADPGGLQHHVNANLSRVDLAVGLTASPEYAGRCGGTDDGFVACLYRDVLGREGGPGEISGWVPFVSAHGRDGTARGFLGSGENLSHVVDATYQQLLLRNADPGGQAGWLQFLASGHSVEELELVFTQTAEFTGP